MATLPVRIAHQQPQPRFVWVRRPKPFGGFRDGVWVVGRIGFPLVSGKAYRVFDQECDHPDVCRLYVWETSGSIGQGPYVRQFRVVMERDGDLLCDCLDFERHGRCEHCEATLALFGEG